jgi:hypothetical protein
MNDAQAITEDHAIHHDHPMIERVETHSGPDSPWGVRLVFGIVGFVLLAGAFVAWQFQGLLGGSVGQALPWLIAAAGFLGAGAIIESITVEIWLALIVGVFAVAVTFVIAGRATTYPSAGQSIFVVDRFSGEVELCAAEGCKVLPRTGVFLTGLPKLPPLPAGHR